jgi:methyltransferase (TIGR00027 family)
MIEHVSDTAFWVATYRAMETDRRDALFRDPLARVLVGEKGRSIAATMKSTGKYSAWTLVIRTHVIDELVRKYVSEGCRTVINLGAGLDTRPYRLDLPSDVHWVELDFPGIIRFKEEKLAGESPRCRLERIAVDLSDPAARRRVFSELDSRIQGPAIVITEGVIPYLPEDVMRDLARDIRAQSRFKYWLGEYYSPKLYPRFQAPSFQKLLGGSPFRFFPTDWFAFFEDCGWAPHETRYLLDEGEKVGRRFPLPLFARLLRPLIGDEAIRRETRLQAYVVFEKA